MLQLLKAGSAYRRRSAAIINAEHLFTTASAALKLNSGSVVSHPAILQLSPFKLKSMAIWAAHAPAIYYQMKNVDLSETVLFCTGKYITEEDALICILRASPCYDHGPVVHDWECDEKQPVVIQIPSRVDHKDFFWPKK